MSGLPKGIEEMYENWESNKKKVEEKDEVAKKEGLLVGRYIKEPSADGFAVYEIIRENKKSVRIRVVTGIGDDWILPMWGEEATVNKDYATLNIQRRDAMKALFNK